MIRKPGMDKFNNITKSIVSGNHKEVSKDDISFIKNYIEYTKKKEKIEFPKELHSKVVDFIASLKKNESNYLIEISPRITIGFMRLCKGLARLENRDEVTEEDINTIKILMEESLKIEI